MSPEALGRVLLYEITMSIGDNMSRWQQRGLKDWTAHVASRQADNDRL